MSTKGSVKSGQESDSSYATSVLGGVPAKKGIDAIEKANTPA